MSSPDKALVYSDFACNAGIESIPSRLAGSPEMIRVTAPALCEMHRTPIPSSQLKAAKSILRPLETGSNDKFSLTDDLPVCAYAVTTMTAPANGLTVA